MLSNKRPNSFTIRYNALKMSLKFNFSNTYSPIQKYRKWEENIYEFKYAFYYVSHIRMSAFFANEMVQNCNPLWCGLHTSYVSMSNSIQNSKLFIFNIFPGRLVKNLAWKTA